jgi:hypothetical protein
MVQEAKSPVKNLVSQCCAEGFNSGIKGLLTSFSAVSSTTVSTHSKVYFEITFFGYSKGYIYGISPSILS